MPAPDITLHELADSHRVKLLAQHPEVSDQEKTWLLNYAKKVTSGQVAVGYNTSRRIQQLKETGIITQVYGRRYPQDNSLGRFSRRVRSTLANGNYLDVDFSNSHLAILKQFIAKNGLRGQFPALYDYVDNRKTHLENLMKLGWSRAEAKQAYLRMTYLGSIDKHCEDINAYGDIANLPEHVRLYGDEIKKASKWLTKNDFAEAAVVGRIQELNKHQHGNYRVKASSYLSCVLGHIEDECLTALCDYLKAEGFSPDVLMYDGVMVRMPPPELNERWGIIMGDGLAEDAIEAATGYRMTLEVKEFEPPFNLSDILADKLTNQVDWTPPHNLVLDCDEAALDEWTPSVTHKFSFESFPELYHKCKAYVERFIFRCDDPMTWLYVPKPNKTRVPLYRASKDIYEMLMMLPNCSLSNSIKPEPFATLYKRDPNKKNYEKLAFCPFNKEEPPSANVYNLFNGYSPQCYLPHNPSQRDELTKPFYDLVRVMAGGDDKAYQYAKRWLAQLIQYPSRKNAVAWIITGNQGTGKGTLVEAMRTLLGSDFVNETANAEQIFGKFAEGRQGKLLVNANECDMRGTMNFEGVIKAAISDIALDVNPKGVRAYKVEDYSRFLITTNKPNPIPVDTESGDRRIFMTRSTNEYLKMPRPQWAELRSHFKKPEFCSAVYADLMEVDVDGYDWVGNVPMSDAMGLMYEANTEAHIGWLSDLVGFTHKWEEVANVPFDTDEFVRADVLYADYKHYCDRYKYPHPLGRNMFQTKLAGIGLDMPTNKLKKQRGDNKRGWMMNGRAVDTHLRAKYPYLYSDEKH
jgi:hypothetical protein